MSEKKKLMKEIKRLKKEIAKIKRTLLLQVMPVEEILKNTGDYVGELTKYSKQLADTLKLNVDMNSAFETIKKMSSNITPMRVEFTQIKSDMKLPDPKMIPYEDPGFSSKLKMIWKHFSEYIDGLIFKFEKTATYEYIKEIDYKIDIIKNKIDAFLKKPDMSNVKKAAQMILIGLGIIGIIFFCTVFISALPEIGKAFGNDLKRILDNFSQSGFGGKLFIIIKELIVLPFRIVKAIFQGMYTEITDKYKDTTVTLLFMLYVVVSGVVIAALS